MVPRWKPCRVSPLTWLAKTLLVLTKLLEAEQSRLLVEIRHTDHRSFREELRRRLSIVERLIDLCRTH
jgi:hypothetical protein